MKKEKRAANLAVNKAIKDGRMRRAVSCVACGHCSPEERQRRHSEWKTSSLFVWHHWSYLPEHHLDVIELCRSCHMLIHLGKKPEPRTGRMYPRKGSAEPGPRHHPESFTAGRLS